MTKYLCEWERKDKSPICKGEIQEKQEEYIGLIHCGSKRTVTKLKVMPTKITLEMEFMVKKSLPI